MNKYIIVNTFCNDKEIADKIVNELLNEKLVAGCQLSYVKSKYYWDNLIEESDEIKLQFRTKESLFNEIASVIKSINNYRVCEISGVEIIDGNEEFFKWIEDNTK